MNRRTGDPAANEVIRAATATTGCVAPGAWIATGSHVLVWAAVLWSAVSCAQPRSRRGDVYIAEVSCRGDDWVELQNRSPWPADLGGWQLTDRAGAPGDHVVVFADGRTIAAAGRLVLYRDRDFGFGLGCGEDTVRLIDEDGTEVDRLALAEIYSSQSWGRLPGAAGAATVLRQTAGAANERAPWFAPAPPPTPAAVVVANQPDDGPCAIASAAAGMLICADGLVDGATFDQLSIPAPHLPAVARLGKFIVPLQGQGAELPPMIQNVALLPLHQEWLAAAFPQFFAGLDSVGWRAVALDPATRRYAAGSLYRLADTGGYVFTVLFDPSAPPDAWRNPSGWSDN